MTFWQGKTIDRDSQVTGWQLLRAVGGGWPQRRENFLGNGNILYLDYDGSFPYCVICQNIFRSCCMHAQLWLILCDPTDCSPPGSSVHGILQARILEWVAMPSSRGVFLTQGSNPCLLCLLHWLADSLPSEPPEGYSNEWDRRVLCSGKSWTLAAKRQKTSRQKKKKKKWVTKFLDERKQSNMRPCW